MSQESALVRKHHRYELEQKQRQQGLLKMHRGLRRPTMSFWKEFHPEVGANVHGVWIPLDALDQYDKYFYFLLKPNGGSQLMVNSSFISREDDRCEVVAEVIGQRVCVDEYYMDLCNKRTFNGMIQFATRVERRWENYRKDNPLQNPFFAK